MEQAMLNDREKSISPDELRALLRYEPETGKLFWRPRRAELFKTDNASKIWNSRFPDTEAFTTPDKNGYLRGTLYGKPFASHRVIWAMCLGEWPDGQIDHVNGIPNDNRIENLRLVNNLQNHKNRKLHRTNTSGVMGVTWYKRHAKWHAWIVVSGKRVHLGYFGAIEEAIKARKIAEAQYGFHANHGRTQAGAAA
jgi:hypothetical protein